MQPLDASLTIAELDTRAEQLISDVQARKHGALSRLKPFVPDFELFNLAAARRAVARDHGFLSWSSLQQQLDAANRNSITTEQHISEFCRLGCLTYSETETGDPQRFESAARLLQQHPEIIEQSLHAACICGDAARVRQWLETRPEDVNSASGYHDWSPIMYAAYARLPGQSTLDVARVLLEYGADPNAHVMWGGQYKFTALTGVFGHGEGGVVRQPEHPDTEAFARLLLDAGANPNDSQAAYNRMFTADNLCLSLLLEYGLHHQHKNNWLLHDNDSLVPHAQETLQYQLHHAVKAGFLERVRLLAEHDTPLDLKENRQYQPNPESARRPVETALLHGHRDIAEFLFAQGVGQVSFDEVDQFIAACLTVDETAIGRLVEQTPDIVVETQSRVPDLLVRAIAQKNISALRRMLALGFDANGVAGCYPMHQAAWHGCVECLQLLIAAGGDTSRREPAYFAPPIGWAIHNHQTEAEHFLMQCEMDVFTAASRGALTKLQSLIAESPALLEARFGDVRPQTGTVTEQDWLTPLAVAIINQQVDCAGWLLEAGASTDVDNKNGFGIVDLARDCDNSAIQQLLSEH